MVQSDRRTLYDGMEEIQERNGSNGVTASYTRGLDLGGGIGGLLARSVPGVGSFYYHYDGSGNVVQLTDAVTQATVARYDYDAFGNLLAWSGPQTVQPYRFSSKAQHSNSGLIDFGFRFYSPELRRFLNRDPIGEAGGVNLYGFVGNSPVNFADADGLRPISNQDLQLLHRLPVGGNLTRPVNGAISAIKAAIAAVPNGSPDPVNLKAAFRAIGSSANPS